MKPSEAKTCVCVSQRDPGRVQAVVVRVSSKSERAFTVQAAKALHVGLPQLIKVH